MNFLPYCTRSLLDIVDAALKQFGLMLNEHTGER